MNKSSFGVYIHIPFCMSKCSYCSFVSVCTNKQKQSEYIKYLCKEIIDKKFLYKDKIVTSIYIGGGTPSSINKGHIKTMLNTIKAHYNISKNAEITIECNPCSVSLSKLQYFYNLGINRISFGVQSLDNNILKILGRRHNRSQAIRAVKLAHLVGFNNISCDLMIGLPSQTKDNVINDIKELSALDIKHFSVYMLMLEDGTKLYEDVFTSKINVLTDEESVNMYNCAYRLLKKLGYNRYEISNFSKKKFESTHNLNYWQMGEYVGFGLSAHSFVDGDRFYNSANFDEYYNYVKGNLKQNLEKLTKEEIIEETIMLSVRTSCGLNIDKLKQLGYDVLNEKKSTIDLYLDKKIIKIKNGNIVIANKYVGTTNQIILNLLP